MDGGGAEKLAVKWGSAAAHHHAGPAEADRSTGLAGGRDAAGGTGLDCCTPKRHDLKLYLLVGMISVASEQQVANNTMHGGDAGIGSWRCQRLFRCAEGGGHREVVRRSTDIH